MAKEIYVFASNLGRNPELRYSPAPKQAEGSRADVDEAVAE